MSKLSRRFDPRLKRLVNSIEYLEARRKGLIEENNTEEIIKINEEIINEKRELGKYLTYISDVLRKLTKTNFVVKIEKVPENPEYVISSYAITIYPQKPLTDILNVVKKIQKYVSNKYGMRAVLLLDKGYVGDRGIEGLRKKGYKIYEANGKVYINIEPEEDKIRISITLTYEEWELIRDLIESELDSLKDVVDEPANADMYDTIRYWIKVLQSALKKIRRKL